MALTYGFYNSIEGDRVYDAIQFGRIFDGIIKDGVYATYEKGMMVIASSNPAEVIIQPGRAWFNHTWSYNDANVIFEAPAPEVLLERIDALVLEINEELSSRENSFKWVTGTPSSRPERPTLTNTSTIHQYPLCFVHRYPETTMIYTRDITNMIGTSECPFATGVLEGIDLDAWINQWDDEFHTWENSKKTQFEAWMLSQETAFTTWYNAFKDQMASDVQEVEDFVDYLESVLDASTAVHLQEEIDDLRDEISSGSHITVTTINSELFGRNVTITEAGGTVFTEKFDNNGVAVFKSVPYVGNLTISSTYGTQTAERVVNTPYYARYEFAIAFWAATVNIVGDPEMSGSSVTVKDSNETVVGTVVLDSEGAGVYTAIKPDTYKFTLIYGGETMEVTLSVTQETTYTVDLHAAGFKWEDWLEAGGVTGSYSSLDDVLADEVALRRLFTVHASVDYLASINDESEDVEKIIGTDLAAKWINLRDYALDTLYANEIIAGYMDTADKYGYGEWTKAYTSLVPTMTSNTAPDGGIVTVDSTYSASTITSYGMFNPNYYWESTNNNNLDGLGHWVQYQFPSAKVVRRVYLDGQHSTYPIKEIVAIKASNTGNTNDWTTIASNIAADSNSCIDYEFANDTAYTYYKLELKTTYAGASYAVINTLQFYSSEWQPKGNVPVMTSNSAPYGNASASTVYSSYDSWKAFDNDLSLDSSWVSNGTTNQWIKYRFVNPICARRMYVYIGGTGDLTIKNFKIEVSNDDSTYTPIYEGVFSNQREAQIFTFDNDNYYLYYRLYIVDGYTSGKIQLTELQFYGRELSVSVPKMDTNTTPYGVASASTELSSTHAAYKPFSSTSGSWYPNKVGTNMIGEYLQYEFTNKVVVKALFTNWATDTGTVIDSTWTVLGSNDNFVSDVNEIQDITVQVSSYAELHNITNTTPYKYYRLRCKTNPLSSGGNYYFGWYTGTNFYGLDYSEKEFEEGTTKKWLYDHGLELEEIVNGKDDGWTLASPYTFGEDIVKNSSDITITNTSTDKLTVAATHNAIDMTPYGTFNVIASAPYLHTATCAYGLYSAKNTSNNLALTYLLTGNMRSVLDISAITQSCYAELGAANGTRDGVIKELWLE